MGNEQHSEEAIDNTRKSPFGDLATNDPVYAGAEAIWAVHDAAQTGELVLVEPVGLSKLPMSIG